MGLYREHAVVLRTLRLGEADRIITFITAGRGKVRAVAKGVRKTKSRFGGRLEPLTHVSMLCYEGRELDIVTQAETVESFRSVREDLDRLAKATSLLEAVDQVAQEGHPALRVYQMLLGALRALAASDSPLLVPAFFLKLLALEGFAVAVGECALCGTDEDLAGFDPGSGGMVCGACGPARPAPMSIDAVVLVRRILDGGLAGALREGPGPVTAEVSRLAAAAMEHHLERRLRSVGVLG